MRILGEGGYGIVYLAERQRPVKRRVALKVIKPGMDTKQVIARFEAERQALALLDHPNIAHVFNAGTTKAGRPYFAMEYVKGVPITEHCDQYKLTIEERLKLFLSVRRSNMPIRKPLFIEISNPLTSSWPTRASRLSR